MYKRFDFVILKTLQIHTKHLSLDGKKAHLAVWGRNEHQLRPTNMVKAEKEKEEYFNIWNLHIFIQLKPAHYSHPQTQMFRKCELCIQILIHAWDDSDRKNG